jgi:hypothetical protein
MPGGALPEACGSSEASRMKMLNASRSESCAAAGCRLCVWKWCKQHDTRCTWCGVGAGCVFGSGCWQAAETSCHPQWGWCVTDHVLATLLGLHARLHAVRRVHAVRRATWLCFATHRPPHSSAFFAMSIHLDGFLVSWCSTWCSSDAD